MSAALPDNLARALPTPAETPLFWPIEWRCQDCGTLIETTTDVWPAESGDDPDPHDGCVAGYTMSMKPFCGVCGADLEFGAAACEHCPDRARHARDLVFFLNGAMWTYRHPPHAALGRSDLSDDDGPRQAGARSARLPGAPRGGAGDEPDS